MNDTAEDKGVNNIVWSGIFQEIGKEFSMRGKLLTERALFISIPAVIFIIVVQSLLQVLAALSHAQYFTNTSFQIFAGIAAATVAVLMFTAISASMLKIEKAIWLRARFDGEKLASKQSWRIARRLWWAWSYLHVKIFFRYYVWMLALGAGTIALWIYLFLFSPFFAGFPPATIGIASLIYIIAVATGFIFWFRRLNVELSYVPFLFLDRYKKDLAFSSRFWRDFFDELNDLNEASAGEGFRKNIRIEMGEDSLRELAERIAGHMRTGFSAAGGELPPPAGTIAEVVTPAAVKSAERHVREFGVLAARYALYHFAYKKIHGKEPGINEYIYSLK